MVVDGEIISIGSANMDFRSLETNFEINAVIYDETLATSMNSIFEADLKYCIPLSIESWNNRSFFRRFTASLVRLVSPLM